MASLNEVTLIGYLGSDPEIRFTATGVTVASLRVATSLVWKDKTTGERKERTEWHRVSLFDKRAEFARDYLKKGSSVWIRGSLHTRNWVDKEKIERYTTEIHGSMIQNLDRKPDGNGAGKPPDAKPKANAKGKEEPTAPEEQDELCDPSDIDIDIPF
jgi:single-strand DNA-binding protein